MIEAMEQQIINTIYGRWTKNKALRKDIDLEKVTESFRVICSSRATILAIINNIKEQNSFESEIINLTVRMEEIYDWVTEETINNIIDRYKNPRGRNDEPIKDKKKEAEYKAEVPCIEQNLKELKVKVIDATREKLFQFYNIKENI